MKSIPTLTRAWPEQSAEGDVPRRRADKAERMAKP